LASAIIGLSANQDFRVAMRHVEPGETKIGRFMFKDGIHIPFSENAERYGAKSAQMISTKVMNREGIPDPLLTQHGHQFNTLSRHIGSIRRDEEGILHYTHHSKASSSKAFLESIELPRDKEIMLTHGDLLLFGRSRPDAKASIVVDYGGEFRFSPTSMKKRVRGH